MDQTPIDLLWMRSDVYSTDDLQSHLKIGDTSLRTIMHVRLRQNLEMGKSVFSRMPAMARARAR